MVCRHQDTSALWYVLPTDCFEPEQNPSGRVEEQPEEAIYKTTHSFFVISSIMRSTTWSI